MQQALHNVDNRIELLSGRPMRAVGSGVTGFQRRLDALAIDLAQVTAVLKCLKVLRKSPVITNFRNHRRLNQGPRTLPSSYSGNMGGGQTVMSAGRDQTRARMARRDAAFRRTLFRCADESMTSLA